MRQSRTGLSIAGVAALLLGACGGGGGGGGGNSAPVANAGVAQSVASGSTVTLNGSASSDSNGSIAAYSWTQTAGTAVTLSNSTSVTTTFIAPQVASAVTLTFQLVVTDNAGATSAAATVTVTVTPAGNAVITGMVRFQRVPFRTTSPFGLDYGNPVLQPARGVIVRAINPANLTELASGSTDASGNYSLTVSGNISVAIQVVAHLQRNGAPRWNVRVQNGLTGVAPYSYTSATFTSVTGARNIDIPSGIAANGSSPAQLSDRASGPFAILDTIYTAMQFVTAVAPATSFPDLVVDWGVQTDGTQFSTSGNQHIQLLSNLSEDPEEFDQHVVAHEFGHYIEHNFSRSDNIGGSHSIGDRLDMRIAFGEGFGHAFAAMVLNDPVVRDSGAINGQQFSSSFNVETNPNPASACWCSETSVAAILWDLHDSASDGSDAISLGFAPIWAVMTGAQRTTPAFTSIFTFITALKASQPGSATLINNLVSAQNINAAGINDFATNETSAPFPNMLPLYATITPGVPVVVRSINDGGHYNKAGNSGLLRFTPASSGTVTMTLTTSNTAADADPDFIVFRNGVEVAVATSGTVQTETRSFPVTGGTTYAIDAYDCANGCTTVQGVPGDYNLTATIN